MNTIEENLMRVFSADIWDYLDIEATKTDIHTEEVVEAGDQIRELEKMETELGFSRIRDELRPELQRVDPGSKTFLRRRNTTRNYWQDYDRELLARVNDRLEVQLMAELNYDVVVELPPKVD